MGMASDRGEVGIIDYQTIADAIRDRLIHNAHKPDFEREPVVWLTGVSPFG